MVLDFVYAIKDSIELIILVLPVLLVLQAPLELQMELVFAMLDWPDMAISVPDAPTEPSSILQLKNVFSYADKTQHMTQSNKNVFA